MQDWIGWRAQVKKRVRSFLVSVLVLVSVATSLSAQVLNEDTFQKWRDFLRPRDSEERAWREIAWEPSLWSGVVRARKEGRPILLWAMNGHPLGCT